MRMILAALLVVSALASITVFAQEYRNMSSVHDGSGLMSDNTVEIDGVNYRHVSAAGQPGGIGTSTNGDLANNAGFLQAVDIKRPNLDTDGDGVIDEISTDNDGDTLTDLEEVQGSEFDPTTSTEVNVADTDDDGASDSDEAAAGTNPRDPNALLQITAIEGRGGEKVIQWTARGGKDYNVLSADGSHAYPTNTEGTVTAAGGDAPWYATTGVFTNEDVPRARSYGVQVLP